MNLQKDTLLCKLGLQDADVPDSIFLQADA